MAAAAALAAGNARATSNPWASGDTDGDVAILRQAFEALHPGLYRYGSKAQTDERFAALRAGWRKARSLREAYLELTRFAAPIRCGHTYPSFFNQSDVVEKKLFGGKDKLPLHFRWLDGRMIVVKNLTDDRRIVPGAEIVAVNGVAAGQILKMLVPLVRADGGNDAKRRYLLEVKGLESVETFDVLYALVFQQPNAEFLLKVRPPEGGDFETTVPAMDLAERRATRRPPPPGLPKGAKDWSLRHQDGVAILTMDDWVTYNTKWDWRGFLDNCFLELAAKRPKGLIVDLRGNEGGEDCGNEIIARLIDADLPLETYERHVRFRTAPENLWPYLDTWDKSFKTLGEGAEDVGGGFFRLKAAAGDGRIITPKGPRFAGKVAVLVDAGNSSATFQFASTIKRAGLGDLIGETTGGNRRGINGGAFFFLRLPATGLEIDLPLIGTFPKGAEPDAGLDPGFAVDWTAEDIAKGRDAVMAAALARLQA